MIKDKQNNPLFSYSAINSSNQGALKQEINNPDVAVINPSVNHISKTDYVLESIPEYLGNDDILEKLTVSEPKKTYVAQPVSATKTDINLDYIFASIRLNEDKFDDCHELLLAYIDELYTKIQNTDKNIPVETELQIHIVCGRLQKKLSFVMEQYFKHNNFSLYVNCMQHLEKLLILQDKKLEIVDYITDSKFINQVLTETSQVCTNKDKHKISLLINLNQIRNMFVMAKLQPQTDIETIKLDYNSDVCNPEVATNCDLERAAIQYSRLTGKINDAYSLILTSRQQILKTENNIYKNYEIPTGNLNLDMELIKQLLTVGELTLAQELYNNVANNNPKQEIADLNVLSQKIIKDLIRIIDNIFNKDINYNSVRDVKEVKNIFAILQHHLKNMVYAANFYKSTVTEIKINIIYNTLSRHYDFIRHCPINDAWKDKLQDFNLMTIIYIPALFPHIKPFSIIEEDANRIRFACKHLNYAEKVRAEYKNKISYYNDCNSDVLKYIESIKNSK